MSDFRLAVTGGVTQEPWEDPADTVGGRDLPSRLNPHPDHGHTRYVGTRGTQVTLTASIPGIGTAPLDVALTDGKLFTGLCIEAPGDHGIPACSSPGGQSSVQHFTPLDTGHYTVQVSRENHGAIIAHIDVDS